MTTQIRHKKHWTFIQSQVPTLLLLHNKTNKHCTAIGFNPLDGVSLLDSCCSHYSEIFSWHFCLYRCLWCWLSRSQHQTFSDPEVHGYFLVYWLNSEIELGSVWFEGVGKVSGCQIRVMIRVKTLIDAALSRPVNTTH